MSAVKKLQMISPSLVEWNYRILVVDDEVEIGKIYQDILVEKQPTATVQSSRSASNVIPLKKEGERSFQFAVTVCNSAAEALKIVKEAHERGEPFAMGFFDVRLGEGMDGIELVQGIHAIDPQLFAVFVTAYNDRTLDSISQVLGADKMDRWDYMNKPFQRSEIIQKARNFVSLWNLRRESELKSQALANVNDRVRESERVTSVAAVARGVAHEFGNLLMQIIGKAEVSLNKPEVEMRQALERIIDASQRASEILDRFNNLADSKPIVAAKDWFVLNDIVKEAQSLMSHQFKNTRTKLNLDLGEPLKVKVNSTSILQILVNLFINSLHAMGEGGQIDVNLSQDGDYAHLQVRDHGSGCPPEHLDKILEPFYTTKGENGTGLGLAISKEIVEIDHRGEFRVANHPEKGFVVSVRLPLKEQGE